MKNITTICLFFLSLLLILASCTANTPVGSPSETTMSDFPDLSTPDIDLEAYHIVYYGALSPNDPYVKGPHKTEYEPVRFHNENVAETYQITLGETTYELAYNISSRIRMGDLVVDIYEAPLDEYRMWQTRVNSETGKPVEVLGAPYKVDPFVSEEEFIRFIKELPVVGDNYDLSEYRYEITTEIYYYTDENKLETYLVPGIKVCGENEQIHEYSFRFTRYVNGLKTTERIDGSIYYGLDGSVLFSCGAYGLGYEESDFSEILNELDSYDAAVCAYLQNNLQDGRVLKDVEISERSFFIFGGLPHVKYELAVLFEDTEGFPPPDPTLSFIVRKK